EVADPVHARYAVLLRHVQHRVSVHLRRAVLLAREVGRRREAEDGELARAGVGRIREQPLLLRRRSGKDRVELTAPAVERAERELLLRLVLEETTFPRIATDRIRRLGARDALHRAVVGQRDLARNELFALLD